jgi:hypothetical protein
MLNQSVINSFYTVSPKGNPLLLVNQLSAGYCI